MDSCSEEESRVSTPSYNQTPHHITAAVKDDEYDAEIGSDNDNDDDDDDDDDNDNLPVDDESQCLTFRSVGDYSDDDDDGDDDPLLSRSVEDLEETDDTGVTTATVVMDNCSYSDNSTLFLRDVPSPSQQRLHCRGDQRLLDDDRPHFTPISKVSAIIDQYNSSITTPTVSHHQVSSSTHHQESPSSTARDVYSALQVENTNCSYLLDSCSSHVSTQNDVVHGENVPHNSVGSPTVVVTPLQLLEKGCLHTTAAVEIKGGTVSPLSVESADCNAATIRRPYSSSRRQLSLGLDGEEELIADEGQGVGSVDHRFYQFVDNSDRPVSTTTAAVVIGVLHVAAVIGLSLLVSAIISLANAVGSMIMMYVYLLLTPWRWIVMLFRECLLALPRWLMTHQLPSFLQSLSPTA